MGTDIHVVAQVCDADGIWRDIDLIGKNLLNRSYTWFTFLDGTRSDITNGDREMGIIPISARRGAPDGFEEHVENEIDTYHGDCWMGYGVTSWVTLAEIIEHAQKQPPLEHPIGPIDELMLLFASHDPHKCRIVFGYDS